MITGYVAEVLHAQDFYPFGMAMPGRSYEAGDYRFGFQGQEQDDEVKGTGNSVNYKYRVHDPRLGRFLSIDPLAPDYPWNSPYAFSENRVIDGVELEGLEYIRADRIRAPWLSQPWLNTISADEIEDQSRYVMFRGISYFWIGHDVYDGPSIISTWLNNSFSPQDWERAELYLGENARKSSNEQHKCTDCHKHSTLLEINNPTLSLRPDQTVYGGAGNNEASTANVRADLIRQGFAESPRVFGFVDKKGNAILPKDAGVLPYGFADSPSAYIESQSQGVRGIYIYNASLFDDYHSFQIIYDNRDLNNPTFTITDQGYMARQTTGTRRVGDLEKEILSYAKEFSRRSPTNTYSENLKMYQIKK